MKKTIQVFIFLFLLTNAALFAQDRLVFNNEKVVECKVLEVTPEVIKYTRYSMPDGPVYTVYKKEVNSIVFENGEIELIKPSTSSTAAVKERHAKRADWPTYRSSWGLDILSPAFGELETWFEIRNKNNKIGHTISVVGFWNRWGYYYDDIACIDGFDCYEYYDTREGGFAIGYGPKFYFIDHPIARPFAGPEVALGASSNRGGIGYFHGLAKFGVALTPKPKFNLTIDVSGGGYVQFDGYSNYGEGLINLGISLGVNYGKGKNNADQAFPKAPER